MYVHVVTSYDIKNAQYCMYDELTVGDYRLCDMGSYEAISDDNSITLNPHSDSSVTHNGFNVEFSQMPSKILE